MRFADVVRLLANRAELPIKPDDIRRIIVEGGIRDDIQYIGVDIDASILRGKLVQSESKAFTAMPLPYESGNCGLVSKVYYATRQPDDIKAMAVIKELLHILDPDYAATSKREQIKQALNTLALPSELNAILTRENENGQTGENSHFHVMLDYFSQYRAMVAMLPVIHRDAIHTRYCENKLSIDDIVNLTGLPRLYARVAMSEAWEGIRQLWLRI